MDIAAIAVNPATELAKSAIYYKEYLNDLQNKFQDNLLKLQKDVKEKVKLAQDNGDVIHNTVQHWIVKVDEVQDEVAELTRQAGEINSSLRGWRFARYHIGTESQKKIATVEELLGEGRSFGSVSNRAPVPPRLVEHFDAFASREPTKKEVIQALMDSDTNLIGVYGMEGVGKSYLVKEVCQEVERLQLFGKVVFATVSRNPDLKVIQREIAENLGMIFEEESMSIRAARLSERLKRENSVLLILDHAWMRLELAGLGIIPCGNGQMTQNTCKVLITSRSLDVCRSMETTRTIEVQGLSERNSLELFLQNIGGVDFNALRKMSEDIINECEGLPFAILAFARALRDKDEAAWPDIIKQIRKSLFVGMSLFDDLQSKVQNDIARLETDVKGRVKLARNNGDVIHQVVEQWLDNVDKVRKETAELYHQAKEINFPLKGRHSAYHRLGEESKKKVVVIDELLVEGRSFSGVSNPAPVPPRVAEHFDAFASREAIKKEVIQALMDDKTNLVGVYGMGGVGKTTLMKEIRKQVEETRLFNKVVFATVSQNPDLRGIQTQIAESLGMKIEEQSIPARAAKLLARLKQEKSIILMLDDLWTRLELTDVGIILDKVSENTCKVIITSRSLDVCNSMGTTKNIDVKVLSKKDSLELFRQEVGDVDFDAQREMSEEIIHECHGLPLAIVTLARALRKKGKHVWAGVIPQLRKSMYGGMSRVIASIKLSYDFLETSETKLCFLLCSLFPEDHRVTMDALVGYAMGENLLGDVETFREAKGNLYVMVDRLVCSGLLLKGGDSIIWRKREDDEYVMMHDIVRDAAISIARENRNESIISVGLGLQKWPELKDPGKCLRMSLMRNDILQVPAVTPDCSQLMTLSLASNRSLKEIPDGFFEGMKCLATLDLSDTGISSLPQSLSSLKNCLRSLYLGNCWRLEDISPIGNLKTLEILGIQRTGISRLPEEISGLRNLKMLNLSDNKYLKCIPPNVISSLSSLEELYIYRSFGGWEIEGSGDNASLAEVASLTNLTSLYLDIGHEKWLSTDIGPCHHWEKLEKFYFYTPMSLLGASMSSMSSLRKYPRCVSLSARSNSYPVAAWVNVLMVRTCDLVLHRCEGLKNVLQLNPKGRFCNLKYLTISDCMKMEYVVNVEEQVEDTMFPDLEVLDLSNMFKLKAIWNGPLVERSFEKLKVLRINSCGELVNVLPSLQNFEQIQIVNCPKLEKVFDSDGFGEGSANMFKLRSIKLEDLDSLTSIWKGAVPLIRLENLKILEVIDCPNLRSRHFFPSVAFSQRFQQLEELRVIKCQSFIKLIAEEDEEEEDGSITIRLPRLRVLQLWDLPRFTSFFSHSRRLPRVLLDCPSLEKLDIYDCPNLKRLPFGPQSTPKLEKFVINDDEWFERLEWDDPSVKAQLQQLVPQKSWVCVQRFS
ncbi:hypothetical protein GIB67_004089 [Kingdonia uniflora]|uniref:AAA+ ATPase domain-containing protein n=1 Tax=Kingdonia uniflora TaxID=39325 RepID=A0A7J7NR49_9MAGN|nr:hypothetical protein GIB67_004089 [Kingdonia uniflora]